MYLKTLLRNKLENSNGPRGFISSLTKSRKSDIVAIRNEILALTRNLECKKFAERVFLVYQGLSTKPTCECGKTLAYLDFSQGYRSFCSVKCSLSDLNVISLITKHKKTPEYREKMRILTKRKIYGFGTEKFRKTIRERYGVENISQDTSIHKRQHRVRSKQYIFPSGRIEMIQGYEHLAIDEILKNFNEDDIVVNLSEIRDLVGRFFYKLGDQKKVYHPDIYIKSSRTIVEVKSGWTFSKELEINMLKKQAVLEKGLNFEFMIFDRNGTKLK